MSSGMGTHVGMHLPSSALENLVFKTSVEKGLQIERGIDMLRVNNAREGEIEVSSKRA